LLEEANIKVQPDWISSVLQGREVETWQETLGILWKHVMASVTPPPSEIAASNHRHTQHYSIPIICNKTASEILQDLATTIIEPTEVLVTGSLYIVGSFLTALEWKEESSEDRSSLLN
jgi:folylpolyglutamate synthase/dihydropteroate synthase